MQYKFTAAQTRHVPLELYDYFSFLQKDSISLIGTQGFECLKYITCF